MIVDKSLFHHQTRLKVHNYEIDWQGVVHNAIYLHYFEIGRIEYLDTIGAKVDINSINHESKVVLARNEIDYRNPARFGDLMTVYSRVSSIRNTSFVFQGILEKEGSGIILAENVAVHVWLGDRTNAPVAVPDSFRKLVRDFEGDDCSIQWPSIDV